MKFWDWPISWMDYILALLLLSYIALIWVGIVYFLKGLLG